MTWSHTTSAYVPGGTSKSIPDKKVARLCLSRQFRTVVLHIHLSRWSLAFGVFTSRPSLIVHTAFVRPVVAVSPKKRYPAAADDNQYHLQALRHLYVLAVQRRGVNAVDVDTGESLFVPIKVVLAERADSSGAGQEDAGEERHADDGQTNASGAAAEGRTAIIGDSGSEDVSSRRGGGGGNGCGDGGSASPAAAEAGDRSSGRTLSLVTPCILPDLKEVSRLSICTPRYFPVELDIAGNPAVASALERRCRIYVKRRVGHLSYKNVS